MPTGVFDLDTGKLLGIVTKVMLATPASTFEATR